MNIKIFLNKIHINLYSIILVFLAFLGGLFKEISIVSIIIIIHEFGHFIVLKHYNWNITKIEIYPFGGITHIDDDIDKPLKEEFIITIMGPIFQEILFILIFFIYKLNIINLNTYELFKNYNFMILIFNLLPILPLDGSKILNTLLNKFLNFRLSYNLNIYISILFLLLFIYIFKNDTSYYIITIFLIYQIINYFKNKYYIFNRFLLEKKLRKSSYIKYKKIDNYKKMFRNKRNLIKFNNSYITEYKYTNKK